MAKYLLDNSADADAADFPSGSTPLHAAAAGGHFFVVDLLLEFGADSASLDLAGRTPAEAAEARGHEETAFLLARHRQRQMELRGDALTG